MESTVAGLKSRSWTKTGYIISTDPSLIPIAKLNDIFGSDAFYWGKSLPEEAMRQTLENSLCFGLYSSTTASGHGTDLDAKDHVGISPKTVRMRYLHHPGRLRARRDREVHHGLYNVSVPDGRLDRAGGSRRWAGQMAGRLHTRSDRGDAIPEEEHIVYRGLDAISPFL